MEESADMATNQEIRQAISNVNADLDIIKGIVPFCILPAQANQILADINALLVKTEEIKALLGMTSTP